jgi:mono/diheme cytochrome c family protein
MRSSPSAKALLFLLYAILALAGCDSRPPAPKVEASPVGPVPAEPQRPGDPAKGYRALLNAPYIGCGVPYGAFEKAGGLKSNALRIPDRSGRNAELPYFMTAHRTPQGVELVSSNCLACHGGSFDGQLVIGLGNENLDFTEDRSAAIESTGAYVEGEAEAAEWRRWADRARTAAAYEVIDTMGVNTAVSATLALVAHRDPDTMAWSPKPLLEPPPLPPAPVSVPPWWRLAKKNALYSSAEARGDLARAMMLGAIYCAEDVDTLRKIDAYAPDIRAYFASIQPPRWPFALNRDLAEKGRAVFEATCSRCHGTYGDKPSYPNLVVATAEIGTDPVLAKNALPGVADRYIRWFNGSFFGETARAAPADGYIAPPLDGVWITAPFLHNGSVPDIAVLLDSSKRPKYWTRSFASAVADYDPETLGWRYTELPYGKDGAPETKERKKIYDTTRPGYSNAGHTFGDPLSDADRKAVLEYLKTL